MTLVLTLRLKDPGGLHFITDDFERNEFGDYVLRQAAYSNRGGSTVALDQSATITVPASNVQYAQVDKIDR